MRKQMGRRGFTGFLPGCWLLLLAVTVEAAPPERVEASSEASIVIDLPAQRSTGCMAEVGLSWVQARSEALIDGEIAVQDCEAAFGEVPIALRWRDADGARYSGQHVERWNRSTGGVLTFETRYALPENAELYSVRARSVSCTCGERQADPAD